MNRGENKIMRISIKKNKKKKKELIMNLHYKIVAMAKFSFKGIKHTVS